MLGAHTSGQKQMDVIKQLKTGILLTPSPQILDVLENFHGRKNARLGVNGNPGNKYKTVLVIIIMISVYI